VSRILVATACANASAAAIAGLPADLAFCHPDIERVVAIDRASGAIELEVLTDSADLRQQIARVVELSVKSYRFVEEHAPLWQHAGRHGDADAVRAFTERYLVTLGPGQYALCGPAARLRASLDARILRIAEMIGAEPWHLPSIEATSDLIPATGYLATHGQYVTFGYRLPCHFETLQQFSAAARDRGLERPEPADLVPTGFILEPFVCHNVYRALRGTRQVDRSITALGTCYRHEGFRFEPLLRQWEFSMREVVLVGSLEHVATQRARLVELTQELAIELDLDARLVIATDPFFVSEAAKARTYQAMNSTKLELVLGVGGAAASFNLHGRHFTEPMAIANAEGTLAETACIAWGIERWMAAIVARWGADPAGWPI
jgi:seryl-tRNA synthetase